MNPSKPHFFVLMTMDASKPLDGRNPRGGQLVDYNSLVEAQSRAENERGRWDSKEEDKWDRLLVCERTAEPGQFEIIERYWKGKKDN
jgi:hypothetical protein